jgi:hypothetical protein
MRCSLAAIAAGAAREGRFPPRARRVWNESTTPGAETDPLGS